MKQVNRTFVYGHGKVLTGKKRNNQDGFKD